MNIVFNEQSKTFHLYNEHISYLFKILKNNQLGQLYFGKAIQDRPDFDHLLALRACILAPCAYQGDLDFSLELLKQEYPAYGTGDFRDPAYQIDQENGSRITNFTYDSHKIEKGKPAMQGLPHTHGQEDDVMSLSITLKDEQIGCSLVLHYHIFKQMSALVRSVQFLNTGTQTLRITRALSMNLDLYDSDYEMIQLDGAWSRERHVTSRALQQGIQSISSTRGASSATHNPFLALKRPCTTENSGEVYGFNLVYSGNFLAQAQVDSYDVTRVSMGIHPFEFEWTLAQGEAFQTPEVVMVYSDEGLSGMSRVYHALYRKHLMRGKWKDRVRPVLLNSWEAMYFNFTEDSLLRMAKQAKELGVELFVLDDGWFDRRNNDSTSLGDWQVDLVKLPNGIAGLSEKIEALGLSFGLWFEPEMVNEMSKLYNTHPDWVVHTPQRNKSYGRNQFVLDYARKEVVDYIFTLMCKTLDNAKISYIKWDMNRNITEAYSASLPKERQKEFFHRYILGVYDLYERLTSRYPNILFESCASGGGRFDAGMLYYAPQAWTSDDTDAAERLPIQYGTSFAYPLISMGSHVAAVPNHQVLRETSLKMRADVAYFGTFGYELDVGKLSEEEKREVCAQISFFKSHRELIQFGDFYRLQGGGNLYSWMVVSKDKKQAILAYYKLLATPNPSLKKIRLVGLDAHTQYNCIQNGNQYYGDELMHMGLLCETEFTGLIQGENYKGTYTSGTDKGDFTSQLYVFKSV